MARRTPIQKAAVRASLTFNVFHLSWSAPITQDNDTVFNVIRSCALGSKPELKTRLYSRKLTSRIQLKGCGHGILRENGKREDTLGKESQILRKTGSVIVAITCGQSQHVDLAFQKGLWPLVFHIEIRLRRSLYRKNDLGSFGR
jgi:hypothetical protein